MQKLCINSRDELYVLDLDKVAYMQANGNYTRIVYMEGMETIVSLGLSKMETMIKIVTPKDTRSPFVRLGRSHIINQNYLSHINLLKQRLTLSDNQIHTIVINMPKALLKAYKELFRNGFAATGKDTDKNNTKKQ